MSDNKVTINLFTQKADGTFVLVLVEEGPWADGAVETNLRRVQERLHNCVDVAVDGHLAKQFPDSRGQAVIIRLDCYDTPDQPVRDLVRRIAADADGDGKLQGELRAKAFIASLGFEYHWRTLGK